MTEEPYITVEKLVKLLRIPRGEAEPCAIATHTSECLEAFIKTDLLDRWELEFKAFDASAYKGFYKQTPFILATGGFSSQEAVRNTEMICNFSDYIIRMGSAGAIGDGITTGDIIIVSGCLREEGATLPYASTGYSVVPDYEVTKTLMKVTEEMGFKYHFGQVATVDAFFKQDKEMVDRLRKMNILAIEHGTSGTLTVAHVRKKKGGAILAVGGDLKIGQIGFTHPRFLDAQMNIMKICLEAVRDLNEKHGK